MDRVISLRHLSFYDAYSGARRQMIEKIEPLITYLNGVQSGNYPLSELRRKIRGSKLLRDSLRDVIIVMSGQVSDKEACQWPRIVEKSIYLLEIADQDPSEVFDLMKLPLEIRRMIYKCVFGKERTIRLPRTAELCQLNGEACQIRNTKEELGKDLKLDLPLLGTCRQIYEEAVPEFYQHFEFSLACFCQLETLLNGSIPQVFSNLKKVKVTWAGTRATGIERLQLCDELDNVVVIVTPSSTENLNERADHFSVYMPSILDHLTLIDAVGFDEISALKELNDIQVRSIGLPPNVSEEDVQGLWEELFDNSCDDELRKSEAYISKTKMKICELVEQSKVLKQRRARVLKLSAS